MQAIPCSHGLPTSYIYIYSNIIVYMLLTSQLVNYNYKGGYIVIHMRDSIAKLVFLSYSDQARVKAA